MAERPFFPVRFLENVTDGTYELELAVQRADGDGWVTIHASRSTLADTKAILSLAKQHLPVDSGNSKAAVAWIRACEAANRSNLPKTVICRQLGWIQGDGGKDLFVLPGRTVAPDQYQGRVPTWMLEEEHTAWVSHYGATAGAEAEAREAWTEIIRTLAEKHPAAFLVMGYLAAAPVRARQRGTRLTGILNLAGPSRMGKTTAAAVGLCVWGPPGELIRPWNMSSDVGIERLCGAARNLPIVLDELGTASRFQLDRLKQLIHVIAGGQGRVRGRPGGGLAPVYTWHTHVLSTAEGRLATMASAEDGVRRRVLDWDIQTVPLWSDAADADRILRLAESYHGWPAQWLAPLLVEDADLLRTMQFAQHLDHSVEALQKAADPNNARLRESALSLTLAELGCGYLAMAILGRDKGKAFKKQVTPKLWDVAVQVLRGMAEDYTESGGLNTADRLLNMILDLPAILPNRFYVVRDGETALPAASHQGVLGIAYYQGDKLEQLAVTSEALEEAARRVRVNDPAMYLKTWAMQGYLTPGKRGYQQQKKVRGSLLWTYVLRPPASWGNDADEVPDEPLF